MKYYTDGSSTIGVKSAHCVADETGKILVHEESKNPVYTNNEEEYRGVISALKLAKPGDEIFTDSQLVVYQINGLYKVKKPHLQKYRDEARKLINENQVTVGWIPREQNLAGKYFE